MKKFLLLLLLAGNLVSCQKDESSPLPEISDVTISDNFDPTKSSLTLGQSLTFSVDAKHAISYQWHVNQKVKGEDKSFVFTPKDRGSYQIKVVAINEDKQTKEHEIGTIKVLDPAIGISGIKCNGVAVKGEIIEIEAGKDAELEIKCTNAEVASCLWSINDQIIEGVDGLKYTFLPKWSGEYKVKVLLKNRDNIETDKTYTVAANGPYKKMPLLITESGGGMTYGEVSVVMNGNVKKDQFFAVNKSYIDASVNDAAVFGNSLYLLSTTVEGFICEADLQTFKLKRKIKKTTPTTGKGTVRRMVIANKDKAYVTLYNPYNAKQGAILIVNLKVGKTETVIDMEGIFDGQMLVIGDKVIFGAGNKLQYLNASTDQVTLIKEFDAGYSIRGVELGKDGQLYVAVAIGSISKIIGINTSSFTIESTADMTATLGNTVALCASSSQNKLYFVSTGSGWGAKSTVYCYDADTKTASVFANTEKEMYGYMTISADGSTLYFPWVANYYTSYGFISYPLSGGIKQEYDFGSDATCKAIHK